ncbi:MAG: phenylacetate--CoA ligase family protein [Pseudomonadota bacterium]|nr:phenylacetate--CoA ligase family protein [Pseudomonadota bacterium]
MSPALPADDLDSHAWPAFSSGQPALLRSVTLQLDAAQWLPAEEVRQLQRLQLARLVDFAWRQVPYYREVWRAAGLDPDSMRFSDGWSRVPVLTRQQVQELGDQLACQTPPSAHGKVSLVRTSGSTGRPVTVAKTALAHMIWRAVALRDHAWHRRDFSSTMATIRVAAHGPAPYPQGRRAADWGIPAALLYRTGASALLDVTTPVDQQLEWLCRQDPGYLLTYPSNALALARLAWRNGVRLPRLRQVRTIGESAPEGLRAAIGEAWNVEVADIYSTQEVGYIAIQCPDNPDVLHVQDETLLVEVLDEENRPCAAGGSGRVVVTPLLNFAMPLIRYEVGDYAVVGEPCPCGRGLGVLAEVLGRVRNMLRLPNGGQAWPRFGSTRFSEIAPITQYQFVQTALDRLVARVASSRPLTEDETLRLVSVVRDSIGHPFAIRVEPVTEIPRSASGKFEEFLCAIDDASA